VATQRDGGGARQAQRVRGPGGARVVGERVPRRRGRGPVRSVPVDDPHRAEEGTGEETGHIQIDFGLDSLFVQEQVKLTEETQARIRENVLRLLEFTKKIEMKTRATSRRLWSESDETLPQKLIARLQKVQ